MLFMHVIGNLVKDAEPKLSQSGSEYTSFTVASTDFHNGREETIFTNCTLFGRGNLVQHLKKGTQVHVTGKGRPLAYPSKKETNADGSPMLKSAMEMVVSDVELLGSPKRTQEPQPDTDKTEL